MKIQKLSMILVVLLFIGNSYSQNLIGNGGLETGSLSPWGAWNPSGTASISNGNAHTGNYSVQLSNGECSIEMVVSGLKPNTQYQLSGWCKLSTALNSVGIGAKNFGGTDVFVKFSATAYEQKSISLTTGASNTSATVFIYKAAGGSGIDYGDDFELIEHRTAPVADFTATPRTIAVGGSVAFTDGSSQKPTAWAWSFAGGTVAESTLQNPTVTYNTVGKYSVTLAATSAIGTSTPVTKADFIHVVDLANASTYYVSNSTGIDTNDGKSPATAWKSLAKVNSVIFNPGDSILFKCGDVWSGQLKPQGSGMANHPVVVDMYGTYTNRASKPHIRTQAAFLKAVHLYNLEYWELNNLQISNYSASGPILGLNGVKIEADNYGVAHHIHVKTLYVHDINGSNVGNWAELGEGRGISWYNHGSTLPSTFDDILIEGCYLERVDREGIMGCWEYQDRNNWHVSTNVVIRNNYLTDMGGDGIVVVGSNKALVEYNVLYKHRQRATDACAGFWPVYADSTVFQYNEASFGKGDRDGMGFDVDSNCKGTVFQYNYSHDNDGGFMLIINYEIGSGATKLTGTTVRYNLSINDGAYAKRLIQMAGKYDDCKIYNNTFYMGQGTDIRVFQMDPYPDGYTLNTVIENNIFYMAGAATATYSATGTTNLKFNNNVFYGTHKNLSTIISNPNTSNPLFVNTGSATAGLNTQEGYKLQKTSPLIGAGKLIANNGGKDFSGNPVSGTQAPTIGAFESSNLSDIPVISTASDLIQVYPNPVQTNFTVESKLATGTNYSLVDFSGKTLVVGKLNNGKTNINCSLLKNGIYFIQVISDQTKIMKSIMVNQ